MLFLQKYCSGAGGLRWGNGSEGLKGGRLSQRQGRRTVILHEVSRAAKPDGAQVSLPC